ncbi:hypothetical protein AAY473_000242 [Plecturocebus cupreus]
MILPALGTPAHRVNAYVRLNGWPLGLLKRDVGTEIRSLPLKLGHHAATEEEDRVGDLAALGWQKWKKIQVKGRVKLCQLYCRINTHYAGNILLIYQSSNPIKEENKVPWEGHLHSPRALVSCLSRVLRSNPLFAPVEL